MRAIREHARDFVAIIVLLIVAAVVAVVILGHQRLTLPAWVPVIGRDFYSFNGEFSTGQAVTPGQGQTIDVAGVEVGQIARVTLKHGRAVIGMDIADKGVRPYRDATMLLRPKTGLKDMTVELNPGHSSAGRLPEGGTIPVSQTAPDVNLDEVLAALDDDTRTYLRALVSGAGTGLKGRGGDLGDALRAFKPTAVDLRRLNGELATRKHNIKRVMHNFSLVAEQLGSKDDQLAGFVTSSNAALGALAAQERSIRATLRGLPPALSDTRTALGKTRDLADQLGPALGGLRPGARALGPSSRAIQPFFTKTTPVIRDSVRPLVRTARPLVAQLRPTMRDLSAATPDLLSSFTVLNRLVDMLAHNPAGDEEGYLFWLSWANHLGASVFNMQDAHGPIRRGLLVASCNTLGILDNVAVSNPALGTTIGLINTVDRAKICPGVPGQAGPMTPTGAPAPTGTPSPTGPTAASARLMPSRPSVPTPMLSATKPGGG